MKRISIFIFLCICKFAAVSVKAQISDTSSYVRNSICIIDFTIQSIDESNYVRQVVIKDFANRSPLSPVFTFEDITFRDDGTGYDVSSGDGIYTTSETYRHSDAVPYDASNLRRSVSDKSVHHTDFLFAQELAGYLEQYSTPGNRRPKVSASITCDVFWCSCSSSCGEDVGFAGVAKLGALVAQNLKIAVFRFR